MKKRKRIAEIPRGTIENVPTSTCTRDDKIHQVRDRNDRFAALAGSVM